MLTTRDAILTRRSIRKFKPDAVPLETIHELLEAARQAPSGSNAQPWRFKIVTDTETKERLSALANHQSFIKQAPVVLVCVVDLKGYIKGTLATVSEMRQAGDLSPEMVAAMQARTRQLEASPREEFAARTAFNMGIAGTHIALRALDFGLGTCWVRALDEAGVRALFGYNESRHVVALLPIGYPVEIPPPRKRLSLEEIILP